MTGHDFTGCRKSRVARVLCQGTTSVVPRSRSFLSSRAGFSPRGNGNPTEGRTRRRPAEVLLSARAGPTTSGSESTSCLPPAKKERPQVRGLNLCLPACIFTLRDIPMSCLVRNDHFCGVSVGTVWGLRCAILYRRRGNQRVTLPGYEVAQPVEMLSEEGYPRAFMIEAFGQGVIPCEIVVCFHLRTMNVQPMTVQAYP